MELRKSQLRTRSMEISRFEGNDLLRTRDLLAAEEPLEIHLISGGLDERSDQSVSITMRTPGNDRELALGFLHGEGIIRLYDQEILGAGPRSEGPGCNIVQVELNPHVEFDAARLKRNFYTTSSCGICSKASLEALSMTGCSSLAEVGALFSPETICDLPGKLEKAQAVFAQTGGLHAAGLFDSQGQLICLREDVGRHNAVDKVVGHLFEAGRLPLHDYLLMVSGRTSFEILQKALMAGIPTVAAVSAPSSLAVEIAQEYGMTLIGFLRGRRFNVYANPRRIG